MGVEEVGTCTRKTCPFKLINIVVYFQRKLSTDSCSDTFGRETLVLLLLSSFWIIGSAFFVFSWSLFPPEPCAANLGSLSVQLVKLQPMIRQFDHPLLYSRRHLLLCCQPHLSLLAPSLQQRLVSWWGFFPHSWLHFSKCLSHPLSATRQLMSLPHHHYRRHHPSLSSSSLL